MANHLANQRAQKALFTLLVYTNDRYYPANDQKDILADKRLRGRLRATQYTRGASQPRSQGPLSSYHLTKSMASVLNSFTGQEMRKFLLTSTVLYAINKVFAHSY